MAHFDNLQGAQYMSLTSYRKSGEPVATPVWFAEREGKLYVMTMQEAYKVKRITNNPAVEVAPCDARGTLKGDKAAGQARVLPAAEGKTVEAMLNKKYGLFKRVFDFMQRNKTRAYIEISAS